jgi:uncharacterized protein
MSTPPPPPQPGSISWADISVPDASGLRDFYAKVTGWSVTPLSMGEYDDYVMTLPGTDSPVAGICHKRGSNAVLPPVWLVYITVADLDASLAACVDSGGRIWLPPQRMGETARYAVIADPAGAVVALYDTGIRPAA